jgi:hypothetical protein
MTASFHILSGTRLTSSSGTVLHSGQYGVARLMAQSVPNARNFMEELQSAVGMTTAAAAHFLQELCIGLVSGSTLHRGGEAGTTLHMVMHRSAGSGW